MAITINLSAEQEAAVIMANGSLDYVTTYVTNYANHCIAKQAEDDKAIKVAKLMQASDKVLDEAVVKAEAEIANKE